MNKKIIIFAWRDLWNPSAGGAECYITEVAEHLASKGFEVRYLTAMYKDAKKCEFIKSVKYIRMGNMFSIYILLPVYYILKLKSYDDIVVENYNVWPFLAPLLHQNRITVIHHLQKEEWFVFFGKLLGTFLRSIAILLLKMLYSGTKVVTVSKSSKEEILGSGIRPCSIELIYNGINKVFFNRQISKPGNCINLLYLGRLHKHKRIDLALDLVSYVVSQNQWNKKNIVLHIAGKGDQYDFLRNKAKDLNISDNVKFHGFVSDDERLKLFQQAHLMLYLSKREGWGITVIEAASQGTPTLCFDVPGLVDSVKNNTGYLVSTKDELFNTFGQILKYIKENDRNYTSKQASGLKWSQNFRWDNQLKKWDNLIETFYER